MIRLGIAGRLTHSSWSGVSNRFFLVALAVVFGVLLAARALGQTSPSDPQSSPEPHVTQPTATSELEPVAVPEPTAKAMLYYDSGNWLWVINRFWALLVPGIFAFSGASARLRDLAKRLGRNWFFTIGLYMLMFLPIIFIVDLPLSYYQGFVRQHAYGLSNQTLAKWLEDAL